MKDGGISPIAELRRPPASHMAPTAAISRQFRVWVRRIAAQSVGQIIRAGFAAIFAARVKKEGEGCHNDEIYS